MMFDTSLFNTQNYKVRINGKVENEVKGVVPFPTYNSVANFTFMLNINHFLSHTKIDIHVCFVI